LLSLLVLVLALPSLAHATIVSKFDTTGLINKIKFTNYETFVVANQGGGFTVVDAATAVARGGQLLSIFSATELTIQDPLNPGVFGPTPAWQKGPGDYFLGYSVVDVLPGVSGPGSLTYGNPSFDPFGKLVLGSEVVWMAETTSDWVITGNIAADVGSVLFATGIVPFATFGINGGNPSNGGEFLPVPGPPMAPLKGISYYGLDVVNNAAGWPGYDPTKAFGNDIYGGANIYMPGQGQWIARSEDPLTFAAVPEPTTLAMWGSVLAIGAVFALRRRQK
jgi:hypothetical protein